MSEELKGIDAPINALEKMLYDPAAIRKFMLLVLNFITLPILVIIRRNFGERSFSLFSLFIAFNIISVIETFSLAVGKMSAGDIGLLSFALLFFIAGIYHQVVIYLRNKRGERWHSYYDGDMLPLFRFIPFASNGRLLSSVYEPGFVFILALIASSFEAEILFKWLFAGCIAMVALSELKIRIWRNKFLDAVDKRIEGENMGAMLEGKPPAETSGFVVKGLSDTTAENREKMLSAMRNS